MTLSPICLVSAVAQRPLLEAEEHYSVAQYTRLFCQGLTLHIRRSAQTQQVKYSISDLGLRSELACDLY